MWAENLYLVPEVAWAQGKLVNSAFPKLELSSQILKGLALCDDVQYFGFKRKLLSTFKNNRSQIVCYFNPSYSCSLCLLLLFSSEIGQLMIRFGSLFTFEQNRKNHSYNFIVNGLNLNLNLFIVINCWIITKARFLFAAIETYFCDIIRVKEAHEGIEV